MPEASVINDLVNDALARWMDLVGIDWEGNISGRDSPWHSWDLQEITETLSKGRELDPTGLTTFMMLRGVLESFLKDLKFTAYDIILDPRTIATKVAPMKALRDVLENPEVVEMISTFQNNIRKVAVEKGVQPGKPMDRLENFLADKYSLSYIRRDAFLSMTQLEVHQFSQGPKDPQPLKHNSDVYEFWNVNSLLVAMRAQRVAGISLCLIRDPIEPLHSYFVFAIRNGGTLTLLTDRHDDPHPMFKRMSRRPDRNLERRAAKNWFPYELLGLAEHKDAEGNVKRVTAEARTQLVPINVEAVSLKRLSDLTPEQFVWTHLVFELILKRFWEEDHKSEELSYTGEMVVEPAALVGSHGSLVKEGLYKPLELPPLTKEDVSAEATKEQWGTEPTRFNHWMEERYAPQVSSDVLNPIGDQALLQLETSVRKNLKLRESEELKLQTFDPTMFGRKEHVQRDRAWTGRYNQMRVIQQLAEEEFEREKETVEAWYQQAIHNNRARLIDAAAAGEMLLPHLQFAEVFTNINARSERNALKQEVAPSWYKVHLGNVPQATLGARGPKGTYKCALRPLVTATIFTVVRPTCPEAIAIVCGVQVVDLPWPLQHWYSNEPYSGNSILDRIDPEEWVLENPWMRHSYHRGFDPNVLVPLSKPAFHTWRAKRGLPRKTWPEEVED